MVPAADCEVGVVHEVAQTKRLAELAQLRQSDLELAEGEPQARMLQAIEQLELLDQLPVSDPHIPWHVLRETVEACILQQITNPLAIMGSEFSVAGADLNRYDVTGIDGLEYQSVLLVSTTSFMDGTVVS